MTERKFTLLREAVNRLEQTGVPFDKAMLETVQIASALCAVSLGTRAVATHLRSLADQLENQMPEEDLN